MPFTFHKATIKDLEPAIALYKAATEKLIAQGNNQWDETYPTTEHLTEDIRSDGMLLLKEAGGIISAISYSDSEEPEFLYSPLIFNDSNETGKVAVLHRLCVHPEKQNSGIGKKIMQLTEDYLRSEGFTSIRLDTFAINTAANKLYKSIGYNLAGEMLYENIMFAIYEKIL